MFVDEVGGDEASKIARNLSLEYTATGGWETVDKALSETGYLYDGISQREQSEESEGEHSQSLRQDPV